MSKRLDLLIVVVAFFTLKTVLTSLFLTLQGKETNCRGHKLTQSKVQNADCV